MTRPHFTFLKVTSCALNFAFYSNGIKLVLGSGNILHFPQLFTFIKSRRLLVEKERERWREEEIERHFKVGVHLRNECAAVLAVLTSQSLYTHLHTDTHRCATARTDRHNLSALTQSHRRLSRRIIKMEDARVSRWRRLPLGTEG